MAKEKRGTLPLDQLYFDYTGLTDNQIQHPAVQKIAREKVSGENNIKIAEALVRLKNNGILDEISVLGMAPFYKILEGNQEVAALKQLEDDFLKGQSIGNLNADIFEDVPVVFLNTNNLNVFSSSSNKVVNYPIIKLLNQGMPTNEVADFLDVSELSIKLTLAFYSVFSNYEPTEEHKYHLSLILDEISSSPSLLDWLEWNTEDKVFVNQKNLTRLFSWISSYDIFQVSKIGRKNYNLGHKIRYDLRKISSFLNDEKALQVLEKSGSLNQAYLSSELVKKNRLGSYLDALESSLDGALELAPFLREDHLSKIDNINKKLKKLTDKEQSISLSSAVKPQLLFNFPTSKHLVNLQLNQYKGFEDVFVKEINKINLFAGENNSGKTTLLEAIRLLIAQNDANDFLALQQLRGKFPEGKMPSFWVTSNVENSINIEGNFGAANQLASIKIEPRREKDETIDRSSYLGSFKFEGSFMGAKNSSNIRLFERKKDSYELSAKGLYHLCSFAFFTPFGSYRNTKLFNAHAESVAKKHMPKILAFLQDAIDEDITSINLVAENGLKRFLVDHKQFKTGVDLNQFGDGLQNIFKTVLLFAIAENGIVLIDEIETAIHHSLLKKYTKFIQELAEEFNAQVFITSHSGECIKAFVDNGYKNDQISMYNLEVDEEGITCKYIGGERYKELNDLKGIDLRD